MSKQMNFTCRAGFRIKRKMILKELENPDSEISQFTQTIVKRILIDQLQTSWNLKCHYDLLNFESQIMQSNLWKNIFKILREKEIIHIKKLVKILVVGCTNQKKKEIRF